MVLSAFVLLTGLAVSWSVHQRAEAATLERLQGLVYGILGATDVTADGALSVRRGALPDRRLLSPATGLYARIVGNTRTILWQSADGGIVLPDTHYDPIGEWRFEQHVLSDGRSARSLQLQSVWELDDGQELPFVVHVVDAFDAAEDPLSRFDRSLWAALSGAAVLLLIVQWSVLRAALGPLRRLGRDIDAMTRGERDALDERLPDELRPLATSVNALRARERRRHVRTRQLLDDLAHNLKTPLSVLSNLGTDTVTEQSVRMQAAIDRYLQRAAAGSSHADGPALTLAPIVDRVADSMRRLYPERDVEIRHRIPDTLRLRAPEADVYEVIGNLLDNACKHGASVIGVRYDTVTRTLIVEDDGPGFGTGDPERWLTRGMRADRSVPGKGLGLAAVAELVDAWGGAVRLDNREPHGAICRLTLGQAVVEAAAAPVRATPRRGG